MREGVRFAMNNEERCASYRLRYKVYVESMGRFRDKGDHDLKELRDHYDDYARVLVAAKNNKAIGTLRLFWGGDVPFDNQHTNDYNLAPFLNLLHDKQLAIVERLMIDQSYRGSMTALKMYKKVMHFVIDHQIEAIFLLCEPKNMNSYAKLGFRPFAKKYLYPGVGPVIPMILIAGDFYHLHRIGSPFASLVDAEQVSYCRYTNELLDLIGANAHHQISNARSFVNPDLHDLINPLFNRKSRLSDARLKLKLSA